LGQLAPKNSFGRLGLPPDWAKDGIVGFHGCAKFLVQEMNIPA
jgi:hypothetical protein